MSDGINDTFPADGLSRSERKRLRAQRGEPMIPQEPAPSADILDVIFAANLCAWLKAECEREHERAEKAEVEITRLRQALSRYGKHPNSCDTWAVGVRRVGDKYFPLACNCGLAAALADPPR